MDIRCAGVADIAGMVTLFRLVCMAYILIIR
jgi:hypothetical protein